MAGHNKWKQIKEHKGVADKRRGALFTKLLRAISVAARSETNPDFNPRLRTALEKARESNVPQENIERAIKKSGEGRELEEITCEAYGPGGAAMLIQSITDSRNRTMMEIKIILRDHGGKWAEPGSVRWVFEDSPEGARVKFPHPLSSEDMKKLNSLIVFLENLDDTQRVFHNASAS